MNIDMKYFMKSLNLFEQLFENLKKKYKIDIYKKIQNKQLKLYYF